MKRQAFTLIELLVSMTVTIFIMLLLTQAFGTGIETFQTLQSTARLQGELRSVGALLKGDLEQSHFDGAHKLSDSTFWTAPPRDGFFALRQGSGSATLGQGTDQLNVATATNHVLHFSSRLKGNRRDSFYFAQTFLNGSVIPAQTNICNLPDDSLQSNANVPTIGSQWAEIAYFVGPSSASPGRQALYRAQIMVFGDNAIHTSRPPNQNPFDALHAQTYGAFATQIYTDPDGQQKLWFCTPKDLASGKRSLNPAGLLTGGNVLDRTRSTLILDNVLSFQVQVLTASASGVLDQTFKDLASFDSTVSSGSSSGPPNFVIKAVKITVRGFDPLKEQTRQLTTIHEL